MMQLSVAFVLVASAVTADKLYCPPGSKGTHPKCICADKYPYDEVNNICSIEIDVNQVCPKGIVSSAIIYIYV